MQRVSQGHFKVVIILVASQRQVMLVGLKLQNSTLVWLLGHQMKLDQKISHFYT